MSKKDSSIPPSHSMNNPNTKRNSNNNNNINKPIINHNKKNNIKSPAIRSNTNNLIIKNNIKRKTKNNKTNKKNQEDKDQTDLNIIGTKNKSHFKLKYLKYQKKSFLNLTDKNSKMKWQNLKNLKTAFSNKEKNLLMNKNSLSKVTVIVKRVDLMPYQSMGFNWEKKPT